MPKYKKRIAKSGRRANNVVQPKAKAAVKVAERVVREPEINHPAQLYHAMNNMHSGHLDYMKEIGSQLIGNKPHPFYPKMVEKMDKQQMRLHKAPIKDFMDAHHPHQVAKALRSEFDEEGVGGAFYDSVKHVAKNAHKFARKALKQVPKVAKQVGKGTKAAWKGTRHAVDTTAKFVNEKAPEWIDAADRMANVAGDVADVVDLVAGTNTADYVDLAKEGIDMVEDTRENIGAVVDFAQDVGKEIDDIADSLKPGN